MLKPQQEPDPALASLKGKSITPEKAKEVGESAANNWFYGEGLGSTALTAGTCLAFPPYIAVVLGNAALSLSGYEPITISDALPEEEGKVWAETYSGIASAPGRVTSAVAGKEFRTKERIKDDYKKLLNNDETDKIGSKE